MKDIDNLYYVSVNSYSGIEKRITQQPHKLFRAVQLRLPQPFYAILQQV